MRIARLATAKEIFDSSMRKSFKTTITANRKSPLTRKKVIESERIKLIDENITEKIENFLKEYPSIETLPPFQKEMFKALVDVDKVRMALGHLRKTETLVQKIKRECAKRIFLANDSDRVFSARNQFIARAASFMERVEKSISEINAASVKLTEIPDLKNECINVLLVGFPNVGKTTMLKRLTGSEAKIASYPFTTKKMNLGYFEKKYITFQVIDTPGLLDKSLRKMNNIERKTIVALKHASHIVAFIMDPSGQCGFTTEEQMQLFNEMKKVFDKEFLVVINKADVATKEQIDVVLSEFPEAAIDLDGTMLKQAIELCFEKNKKKFMYLDRPVKP